MMVCEVFVGNTVKSSTINEGVTFLTSSIAKHFSIPVVHILPAITDFNTATSV
jgi:hypothetical protein